MRLKMKVKYGFILMNFADKYVAVAADDNADSANAIITLNKSGAFAWELLENEITYDDLVKKLLEKYAVSEETAKADLGEFLDFLRKASLLNE